MIKKNTRTVASVAWGTVGWLRATGGFLMQPLAVTSPHEKCRV